ncbi:uncharacterized protein B0P05DRAFT_523445 [Gilbertella persicaria]|uniref:uncharacterized protein n=1 Tax=Gilbertella persicaria TaxID=101096 RepID=UPI00221ED0AF|nr:uncharacterized protein B0P05DRAFT_523445 [Gilbertella persicaria]KAI8098100.1 hypothetical protein B0P05DRAFT_523445 [Gilbertella persicaria]
MSYISSLNLLGDDSPVPLSEETLSEELALWANAQFTFDTKPGTAIHDDSYKENIFSTFANLNDHLSNDKNQQEDYMMNTYLNILPNTTINPSLPASSSLPRIAPAPAQPQPPQFFSTLPAAPAPNSKKRKAPLKETEETIDEDKRRRNTAASARFRMKKKLKEQALERTAKEMTAKAEALEKRVLELEKEAQWLRALVIEKDPALIKKDE